MLSYWLVFSTPLSPLRSTPGVLFLASFPYAFKSSEMLALSAPVSQLCYFFMSSFFTSAVTLRKRKRETSSLIFIIIKLQFNTYVKLHPLPTQPPFHPITLTESITSSSSPLIHRLSVSFATLFCCCCFVVFM